MKLLERWARPAAILLLVLAAIAGALRIAPLMFALAAPAIALLVVPMLLSAKKTAQELEALALANGKPAPLPVEMDGQRWLAERGFTDLAGQPVRRFAVRSLDVSSGTVNLVEGFVGEGRNPLRLRAAVFTAQTATPGAVCLYEAGAGSRLRAKLLGGSVSTGTEFDEKFVPFAKDRGAAVDAVRALDADAVNGLLRRCRELGAREDLAFAVAGGRASVLIDQAPTGIFRDETVRELLATLSVTS